MTSLAHNNFTTRVCGRYIALLAAILLSCTQNMIVQAQPQLYYQTASTRKILQLTGDNDQPLGKATNSLTGLSASLFATDLGSTFEHNGKLMFLFGDTWGGRDGLLDSIATSTSTDPFSLQIDVTKAPDGKWRPITPPGLNHAEFCVPSHGISIDGTIYVVFTQPGSAGAIMKRSFMIASSDDGATWQTLYQLNNGTESNPKFVNVWLEEHGDYIYMFGCGQYRASSPYLARALKTAFPQKSAWEYYAGVLNENPVWSSMLAAATPLFIHNQLGEFSCCWIQELDCWVMLYNSGNPRGITLRRAATPWGPWSGGTVIMDPGKDQAYGNYMHISWEADRRDMFSDSGRENEWGGEYGPYVIPRFTANTSAGCQIYYTMSTWNPYQVVLMRSTLTTIPPTTPPPTSGITLSHDLWHRYPDSIAQEFLRDGRPHITTYDGDQNVGWLWQTLPSRCTSISFLIHGGHCEVFLLENSSGLPSSGNINAIDHNLRAGAYGHIVRRATGVEDNNVDIPWTWDLRPYDRQSLALVVLDSDVNSWGFVSLSDIHAELLPAASGVRDWALY